MLAAATALGYRPNTVARSLVARRGRALSGLPEAAPRLIAICYVSIDYMVEIDRVPQPGARTSSRSIEKMLGEPAANVAVFAAGMDAPLAVRAELVTLFGDDADSAWALERLAERGVDCSEAMREPGARLSRCIVMVEPDGKRTIINEPCKCRWNL